jgi:hypothetical protein
MLTLALRTALFLLLVTLLAPLHAQEEDFLDDFDFVDEEDFFDPTTGTYEEWLQSEDAIDWDADGDVDEDDYDVFLWLFDEATGDLDGDGFFDEEDFFLSLWLDGPDAEDLNGDGFIDDIDYILALEDEGIFANEIDYVLIEPGFETVIVEWETFEPGYVDSIFLRELDGPDEEWDVYVAEADEETPFEELFEHLVVIEDLEGDTEYEIELRSVSIDGFSSDYYYDVFRTRSSPDLRPAAILDLEYETDLDEAFVFWETNRLTDARYELRDAEGVVIERDTLDIRGEFWHEIGLTGLQAGAEYELTVESVPVGLAGLVAEEEVVARRTVALTARTGTSPVRLLYPPYDVVGPNSALIEAEFNQSVRLRLDYARVDNFRSASDDDAVRLYKDSLASGPARVHLVNLSKLKPDTAYRYRLVAVSGDGDTLTTDPSGLEQWSYDWQFVTSDAGDTLAPEIIEGPEIVARDRIAVLEWVTDVETTGKVFYGTAGGTFGTGDEFSVADLAGDGTPWLSDEHTVTLSGLAPGTTYQFRIESTAANGKKVTFTPGAAAKGAGLRQPPGGAGSFTTTNVPDTQRPVIIAGPTVTSRTHAAAVVEWQTDEPADSQVRFGVESLADNVRSGESSTSHRLVLSNLQPGTTYRYSVASTDAVGNGPAQSAEGVLTTNASADITAPLLTSAPSVTYRNDRSATLRWTTDEVSSGRVSFGTTTALGSTRELSQKGTQHVAPLTNLQPSTRYYYRVAATDLSNNGPTQSAIDSFVTDAAPDLASPVLSALSAIVTDSLAVVRWQTDEPSDSFVEFGIDSLLLGTRIGDGKDVLQHRLTLTNLTPGTRYYYKVGSIDPASNPVTESATASFVTLVSADTSAPSAPSNLQALPGSQQVVLRWRASDSPDVAGYNISRSLGGGAYESVVTRVADTTYTDLGLTNGAAYAYRVVAVDLASTPNLSAAAEVQVSPALSSAPTAPLPTRAQGSLLTPTLVFANAAPFQNGATLTYAVQVSTDSAFTTFAASVSGWTEGSGGTPGQTTWTVDRALTQNTTYYWRVRAAEGEILGPFSPTATFVTREGSSSDAVAGDFNGDRSVTFDDFFLFVDAFGKPVAEAGTAFDLDGSGAIDFSDFFLFVDAFGRSSSGKSGSEPALDSQTHLRLSARGDAEGTLAQLDIDVGVDSLRSFGVALTYDPARVRFDGLTPGDLLEEAGQAPFLHALRHEPGRLSFGNGLVDGSSVSGQGRLASAHFTVLGDPSEVLFTSQARVHRDGRRPQSVAGLTPVRLLPQTAWLGHNYPNPFNPSTQIRYSLPADGRVRLRLFDVLGRALRVLVDESRQRAGYHTVRWDGRDGDGRAVASGVYFMVLETEGVRQTRRMVLLK